MTRPAREQGVALALVLWLLVVLGAIGAMVTASARTSTSAFLNLRTRVLARYAAESGIVTAIALIERRLRTADTPALQVLAFEELERDLAELSDVALGEAQFGVAMENLSARLDLNRADPAALVGLFSQFVRPDRASAIGEALQDWRDADDLVRPLGAERDAYLRAGLPFLPRNAPLRRPDELDHVLGATPALGRAVAPYVTVNGDLRLDVNAAPEPVLAAVPGIGADGARRIISARRSGKLTSVPQVLGLLGQSTGGGPAPVAQLATSPSRVLIVSRGWSPGHPLTHEIQAAYTIVAQRLVLQGWRERDL